MKNSAEMLTPQECALTMMQGIGFSRRALEAVPTRFVNTRLELYSRGYDLRLDKMLECYYAVKR